ncbi:hypothetical protein O6H91_15G057300 [Diphasiastrum complanatum]|uniref:Uncharacterized protein n=1 Tax=Diphasiastrum complanatum TaxID=34168 RepID=A0ACC2BII4_DIPCM|nr:hypothetical protein O6H91_15G057300 [Diphasiastrum complanatum]
MNPASKALMRSRMKEASQKRDKRIESPLVQYNDVGQPVCKVCSLAIKSESLWIAHIASRQHKDAVEDMKARAKLLGVSSVKSNTTPVVPIQTALVQVTRTASALPADFFDSSDNKRARTDTTAVPQAASRVPEENRGSSTNPSRTQQDDKTGNPAHGVLPEGFFDSVDADHRARGLEPPKVDIHLMLWRKEKKGSILNDGPFLNGYKC